MTRAFKTFLVWLLMAVLPLHAVAAGVGMSCMPQHQAMSHAAAAATQHHAGGDEHAQHAGHGDAAGADHASDAEKQTHTSCSACSVFCIGAVAPPSDYLPVFSFDGSDAVLVAPAAFAAGFIPDGPQRPPRRHYS